MEELKQIASRLKGLREALELSLEQMADQCQVEVATLQSYETGLTDIPVSFLSRLASTYGVELTSLMFGAEPRMKSYFVTRAGHGVKVERSKAYSYQDLAAGFQRRIMAPFLVTIEPSDISKPMNLNIHGGQEYNYVLSGKVEISIDGRAIVLHTGDSIFFDAHRPHGLRALGDHQAQIIAIIS